MLIPTAWRGFHGIASLRIEVVRAATSHKWPVATSKLGWSGTRHIWRGVVSIEVARDDFDVCEVQSLALTRLMEAVATLFTVTISVTPA